MVDVGRFLAMGDFHTENIRSPPFLDRSIILMEWLEEFKTNDGAKMEKENNVDFTNTTIPH